MCRRPIAEELVEALDEVRVKWPGRKVSVVVVGHALGGALAVLISMVLAASPMVDSVITYTEGCPSILTDVTWDTGRTRFHSLASSVT